MGIREILEILIVLYSIVITIKLYKQNNHCILGLNLTKKKRTRYWNNSDWGKLLPSPNENKIH